MLTEEHGRALNGAIYGCSCRHSFLVTFLSFQCVIGAVAAALVSLGKVSHASTASVSLALALPQ